MTELCKTYFGHFLIDFEFFLCLIFIIFFWGSGPFFVEFG